MKKQFGDVCLSLQQMYEWDRKLNVVSSVADAEHTGCPYTVYTPETVEHTEWVIQGNHLVTTVEVVLQLGISHGSAHHIMHDRLQHHIIYTHIIIAS
jgi:enoyl reductase-like protein